MRNDGPLGGRGKKRNFTKFVVSLEPGHVQALRGEAVRRMMARGVGRMDAGEIIREAVDAWVRRHKAG